MTTTRDERAKRRANFDPAIKWRLSKNQMTMKELAKKIDISYSTLRRKCDIPEEFTVNELYKIGLVLDTTIEELIAARIPQ